MEKLKEFYKTGDIFIWFTGFGLAMTIVMIAGLMILVVMRSTDYFYPSKLALITTNNGEKFLGEIKTVEEIPEFNLPDSLKEKKLLRYKMKIGNRDIYGLDYRWFDGSNIKSITYPEDAVVLERREYGNFHGIVEGVLIKNRKVKLNNEKMKELIEEKLALVDRLRDEIRDLEKDEIGSVNYDIEQLRMEIKKLKYYGGKDGMKIRELESRVAEEEKRYKAIEHKVDSIRTLASEYVLSVRSADMAVNEIQFLKILKIYRPNQMGIFSKAGFIITKLYEFVFDEPRESNTEGGVFPAIFGTVMMVMLMSLSAVPFGVISALYLREYAKQGMFVRIVRIAVNNLAGVPSIVFGVFGLGFFIYFLGGSIDQLFYPERLPAPTWGTGGILWASLTLSLLTVPVVIVSTEEALAAIPRGIREAALALGSTKWQMIRKIVLPAATPGILTGVILAMARGAGEVAPLMITGVVKLAPNLPMDWHFPFFHLDRKFMHLGFHIYDVGFQSPNVEAALPMVYMTTLLLIVIVLLLNLTAMVIRSRLREKYKASTF